jgi:quercetin dioxygenase-like cupin family protein
MQTFDIAAGRRPSGWSPIRRELGVQAFGVNAWHGDDGAQLVGEHSETSSGHEELYVVVEGAARFTVDGEERDVPAGTAVFVADPESKRAAVATQDGTTIISVGGKAGEAYEPRAWEINAEVFALFERGEIEQAKAMVLDGLERFDDAALTYNLACCEARLGETEPAIEHLAAALEMRPSLAELARGDGDLDALRSDPRFDELLAARSG